MTDTANRADVQCHDVLHRSIHWRRRGTGWPVPVLSVLGAGTGIFAAGLEALAQRKNGDSATGILGLAAILDILIAQGVGETIKLTCAAVTLGIGADVGGTNDPARNILGHAQFPVGIACLLYTSDAADE